MTELEEAKKVAKQYINTFDAFAFSGLLDSCKLTTKRRILLMSYYGVMNKALQEWRWNAFSNNYRKLHHIPMRRKHYNS